MSEPTVTYTLSVTVVRPVERDDPEATLTDVAETMRSRDAQRTLEREVLRALRVLDGDCDCEVLLTHTDVDHG